MRKILLLIGLLFVSILCYGQLEATRFVITDGIENQSVKNEIQSNATYVLTSFNMAVMEGKKPRFDKDRCTEGATKQIDQLWKTSIIACPLSSVEGRVLSLPGGGWQVRNIPVTVLSAPEDKQAQEIVINFDAYGRIDCVNIALEENRYVDIIGANISVNDFVRRQVIVDFVENFRTAYNRKDLAYLNKVFSDNALIITGKVIRIKQGDTGYMNSLGTERIKYVTQSKAQYLEGLKRCFQRNKYIDVQFDEVEVIRHPADDTVYGVTLKQDWGSSTYNDTGYVFLLIDFKDETQPCIQVRTWQPEKYNNKVLSREERFDLTSFNIR